MPKKRTPFERADVESVFAGYPSDVRAQLLRVRQLIFDTAAVTPGVGSLEETLRWGEPTYLTTQSKSGSMLRLHWKPADGDHYRLYVHCQTNLIATFRASYPELHCEGTRSIALARKEAIPIDALRHFVTLALTYHLHRKARNRA